MNGTVVVGVESSDSSHDALLWAARAAYERGCTLELVYATGFPTTGLELVYDEAVRRGAYAMLEKEAIRAAEAVPRLKTELVVDRRTPAQALCERSRAAVLLVVGSHQPSVMERVFSGSLAYQVAAGASCPVAVVPRLAPAGAAGVVVGVDGSEDSLDAVGLAAAEADRSGQELHVVHAWQEPAAYLSLDYLPPEVGAEMEEAEGVVLGECVAGLAELYPDLVVHQRLVRGHPAAALLDAAQSARMLVVGSRGRHGVVRMLLGSVSHTVVLRASCPVLLARTHGHHNGRHDGHG